MNRYMITDVGTLETCLTDHEIFCQRFYSMTLTKAIKSGFIRVLAYGETIAIEGLPDKKQRGVINRLLRRADYFKLQFNEKSKSNFIRPIRTLI